LTAEIEFSENTHVYKTGYWWKLKPAREKGILEFALMTKNRQLAWEEQQHHCIRAWLVQGFPAIVSHLIKVLKK
jgi:hypothetical protein